ncbi:aldehyde dehydrogenase family protein [Photobacterium sp. DNB23_23_1]|uniref:Aldehyde dehydrogenase EutE n=1 Tax=Photobacterium pectinilyticum TaxID=2906793 RepID=A0ABT1N740_9GAMM|nr:aldehyde dehydrogenase family protein [Photobacterium sp. ZSDE20]MCQ1059654.1 aldehyde dehydrogenase EutE [Photobacterium sp. ZSDE20]MDD1825832.1 aldehyde dehydrogenase EutE [Photobacterium sp. ZSDE20]
MSNLDIDLLVKDILAQSAQAGISLTPQRAHGAGFESVDAAISAAKHAFIDFNASPMSVRKAIIDGLRVALADDIPEMAEKAWRETGMGNVSDKVLKNKAALENTPGTEDLATQALTGDGGLTLFEYSPYGVIGAIAPSTNPTETIINNAISMIAAGNSVIFSPHPGAKDVSIWLINKVEQIIFDVCGIRNLVVSVSTPSFDSTKEMMVHPDIPLLVVTGGPGIVNMAMKTGKKVIGAGAGNPPVIVDESADIEKAAKDIISGASFDYNLPCIAEKAVLVVESVAQPLLKAFDANGACWVQDPVEVARLRQLVINEKGEANKSLVGKSPASILEAAGIDFNGSPKLVVVEVGADDPLMLVEQLMPLLPVAVASSFDDALSAALRVEGGNLHTAIMHSKNIDNLNRAARVMRTSIFVKNAPSFAGIGVGAEGFTTFTIATPTGEGTTSARSFARLRRCVLSEAFNIR